ncbi:MAG: ABC transporter ATP-binding protein [Motilibacteraceae bacterium]
MHASDVLLAHGLRKVYGDVVALDDAHLALEPGEVRGLVGPNGAGKTTLLGILLGLTRADGGELHVLGRRARPDGTPPGVAGFVDTPALYPALTARDNLHLLASLSGPVDRRAVQEALERVGLGEVSADRVRGFSLGMRQRLGLATALMARPRLLVLDEPANGLDPAGTRHVHRVIGELAGEGTAVLLSSHRMDELAAVCGTVTVLHQGHVCFDGAVTALAATAGPSEHRLVVDDADRARALATVRPDVRLPQFSRPTHGILVRATTAALDRLVADLVADGVALRELTPVRSALEVALDALTGGQSSGADTPEPTAQFVA